MPHDGQQQMSHADRHDLDKLTRWKSGLDGAASAGDASFPVCAIFLVGPDDRASHDIFRRYRSEFEELGGGFHHLVIFGQHGVSTTRTAFLGELGDREQAVPLLVVASGSHHTENVHCVPLPPGERDGALDDSQPWGAVLALIRRAAVDGHSLTLQDCPTVVRRSLLHGSLAETVSGVLVELLGNQ